MQGSQARSGHNVSPDFLAERAKFIRLETVRLSRIAGAGHYSSTFSAAELLAALYYAQLRIDPAQPGWPDRDRFVLSKGHAAIGLYPVLADLGYFDKGLLDNYTRFGSPFGDHPDMKKVPGIDFSSGSLGHGLSIALGMALGARVQQRSFRVYCMLGDGELHEGQVWEAAMAAAHYRLQGLVAIVDRNRLCIDGTTEEVMQVEPIEKRFESFGWQVTRIDGHDVEAILSAFDALPPVGEGAPRMIVADTIKGRGVKRMELSLNWHVGNLVGSDYDEVVAELEAGLQPLAPELVR
ncbi:transketolase [Tistlia consotensis]|uniref:Transketolase n=1 Tax=Tistlia consotensis USBA 355 TaxID=560819 RepID=A0A1Y6BM92_9PROT|nr:transketolase [Tistlia consotensis]SMF16882.1 transketolase [Tistlia consotensis USBA 355]SNR40864.1 transketolase [Tistlia consotensis]